MPRNNKARVAVFVAHKLDASTTLNYGFNSGLADSKRATFGQTVIDFDAVPAKTVFGANSPKPYRASKKLTTGYESSYCSDSVVAALKTAKYTITRPKKRTATKSALSDTYYVDVQGIKYAWSSPKLPVGIPASYPADTGVTTATSAMEDLVFGATYPKPARYSVRINEGTATESSFSSFVEPTKEDNLPNDWRKMSNRKLLTLAP
jgi:hypothetical protein